MNPLRWMRAWLCQWLQALREWRHGIQEPFDLGYPDSAPPPPDDLDCPDTQPTAPGALDTDLGRLEP